MTEVRVTMSFLSCRLVHTPTDTSRRCTVSTVHGGPEWIVEERGTGKSFFP